MVRNLISLPLVVMVAWAAGLAWLLHDFNYQLFLAPKFGMLVYLSLSICVLFGVSLLNAPPAKGSDHLVKGLILILPLVFILSAGESTLGNFALSKRSLAPAGSLSDRSQTEPDPAPAASSDPETGAMPLISIAQLIRNWEAYEGRQVRVEGLFAETVMDHEELSAVFRYFVTCCAADALPVGVFIARKEDSGIKKDDWVRVGGKVRMDTLDGYDIIFMEADTIEKRDKPSKNAAYIY